MSSPRCYFRRSWQILFVCAAILIVGVNFPLAGQEKNEQAADSLNQQIAHLIKRLGHKDFTTRENAQARLTQIGLAAFDPLMEALEHDHVEVALRARYLVRSLRINWQNENDPPEVKSALHHYSQLDDVNRRSRIDLLASLDQYKGNDALCRIVRFEANEILSKQAALAVMRQKKPAEAESIKKISDRIITNVGQSRRVAASWLKAYVATLADSSKAIGRWQKITRQEQEVFSLTPEKSNPEILGELLFWQADMLHSLGRDEQVVKVIFQRFDVLEDRRVDALETLDWLIHLQAWDVLDEVSRRLSPRFESDAEVLYRLAEAREKQGNVSLAEEIAAKAFQLNTSDFKQHLRLGVGLSERGLRDWSEREHRYVMEHAKVESSVFLGAHVQLSEMLHDVQKDLPAAQVLDRLLEIVGRSKPAGLRMEKISGGSAGLKARMHVFYALHYSQQKDRKKEIEHLEQAVAFDKADVDVLIAMYRIPQPDEQWQKRTIDLLQQSLATIREHIAQGKEYLEKIERLGNVGLSKKDVQRYLATQYNQLSWLVSNTEGDYDEALRLSHESLKLLPNRAEYLDTLGRCYFAKGDYRNAVKYQKLAVEGEPHSGQIQSQLELFLKALDKQQENKPDRD